MSSTDNEQPQLPRWELHLILEPTDGLQFFKVSVDIRLPDQSRPLYINDIGTRDMLYERIQGHVNNALRRVTNNVALKLQQTKKR